MFVFISLFTDSWCNSVNHWYHLADHLPSGICRNFLRSGGARSALTLRQGSRLLNIHRCQISSLYAMWWSWVQYSFAMYIKNCRVRLIPALRFLSCSARFKGFLRYIGWGFLLRLGFLVSYDFLPSTPIQPWWWPTTELRATMPYCHWIFLLITGFFSWCYILILYVLVFLFWRMRFSSCPYYKVSSLQCQRHPQDVLRLAISLPPWGAECTILWVPSIMGLMRHVHT